MTVDDLSSLNLWAVGGGGGIMKGLAQVQAKPSPWFGFVQI